VSDHRSALLALVAFAAVVLALGRAHQLVKLPLLVVGGLFGLAAAAARGAARGLARRLGLGWPQWCWLAATVLLVGQADRRGVPARSAWAAAGFAWGGWLLLHVRAAGRRRRAPKRHAKALREHAAAMQASARTTTAAGAAARAKRAATAAARASTPRPVLRAPERPGARGRTHDTTPDQLRDYLRGFRAWAADWTEREDRA